MKTNHSGTCRRAYEKKTAKDDYHERQAPNVQRKLLGEPFDEDRVYEKYPKLAARFGG